MMGLIETEAIVLRTYNLSEADKIVVCLTRASGIVRGVARGARRLKSKFGAGLEPLTILHISYYEKEGRELVSLRQVEIQKSFFSLATQIEAVTVLAYMSEIVQGFAPPNEPNEKMFRMVKATVEALALNPAQLLQLVRYFEVWTLKLAGFFPDLRSCAECRKRLHVNDDAYFNAESSRLRCEACSHKGSGIIFSKKALTQLRAIEHLSPLDFALTVKDDAAIWMETGKLTQSLIARVLERQTRVPSLKG